MPTRIETRRNHISRQLALACLIAAAVSFATAAAEDSASADKPVLPPLGKVSRNILKEPTYKATPRYALMVFGLQAETRVWMVEDGNVLYVDKNANGDLTDDGQPLEPSNVRQLNQSGTQRDYNYLLDEIVPADGSAKHTKLDLRRWNYENPEDRYGLSINVEGSIPMYAGWFGTFWAKSPADVDILYFGGPLKPRKLREKVFRHGSRERLSFAFENQPGEPGSTTRLNYEALPPNVIPRVEIDWPVPAGSPPLRTTETLTERCCYWEFYSSTFRVPKEAVNGTAKVTFSFTGGWLPFELATPYIAVPVQASK